MSQESSRGSSVTLYHEHLAANGRVTNVTNVTGADISVNMREHLVSEGTMMSLLSSVLMSSLKQADLS